MIIIITETAPIRNNNTLVIFAMISPKVVLLSDVIVLLSPLETHPVGVVQSGPPPSALAVNELHITTAIIVIAINSFFIVISSFLLG